MPHATHEKHDAADDLGLTLTLSEEQLHAIGLNRLPAAGARVHLRATATVQRGDETEDARNADLDAAQDGDQDTGEMGTGGADEAEDEKAGGASSATLTLHLSGLTLMPVYRAPDKVLYGGGD